VLNFEFLKYYNNDTVQQKLPHLIAATVLRLTGQFSE